MKMVKIAFWDNTLCERGTTIALFDYAYFNKYYLKNESIIMFNKHRHETVPDVIEKFKKEFEVYGLDPSEIQGILESTGCDIFYSIGAGDHIPLPVNNPKIKTCVHAVFTCSKPHGDVYASIGPWIPFNNGRFPFVPHMINLPNHDRNMRAQLSIPETATVFGRHGGYNEFDIPFVQNAVWKAVNTREDLYFIFLNTRPFCPQHPRVIHLDKIIDLDKKVEFINTCDAMLWGRSGGESFGLAIGEFSIKNKPVFSTFVGGDNGHMHILGEKGIWYNESNLLEKIINFNPKIAKLRNWNAHSDYTPEKVMDKFKEVFIDSA